jgi:hypothetical protein
VPNAKAKREMGFVFRHLALRFCVLHSTKVAFPYYKRTAMELDENAKQAVRELGDAINSAIEKSERVMEAIERLRSLGYEPNLALKLEIGLLEIVHDGGANAAEENTGESDVSLNLTDEDLRTLRSMKIRLE